MNPLPWTLAMDTEDPHFHCSECNARCEWLGDYYWCPDCGVAL